MPENTTSSSSPYGEYAGVVETIKKFADFISNLIKKVMEFFNKLFKKDDGESTTDPAAPSA